MIEPASLRIARAAASVSEADWKGHKRHCPRCSMAAHARDWDHLCGAGAAYRDGYLASARELKTAKAAAEAPNPDQAALFDATEVTR